MLARFEEEWKEKRAAGNEKKTGSESAGVSKSKILFKSFHDYAFGVENM